MKMVHLQNIQSFETSIESVNLQSYDEQSIVQDITTTLAALNLTPHWWALSGQIWLKPGFYKLLYGNSNRKDRSEVL